jgi:hypothetical protein
LVGVYIPCDSAWTMWSRLCSEKEKWHHCLTTSHDHI